MGFNSAFKGLILNCYQTTQAKSMEHVTGKVCSTVGDFMFTYIFMDLFIYIYIYVHLFIYYEIKNAANADYSDIIK